MSEIPIVVVDAQRGGPSTGLPTKMEQSDLNLAVYGAHGDAPRIVLAPGDVWKNVFLTSSKRLISRKKYQMPVIFLTDSVARPSHANLRQWRISANSRSLTARSQRRKSLKNISCFASSPNGVSADGDSRHRRRVACTRRRASSIPNADRPISRRKCIRR